MRIRSRHAIPAVPAILTLAAALALPAAASASPASSTTTPAASAPDSLAALAWMAGSWSGIDETGTLNEERWMEPAAGMMLAVHRDTAGGKAKSFEFLRIESTPDGIVYFASPRGKEATPFRLVESAARKVVFENPQIEFPRRILYWMEDDTRLHARIEGASGGKPMSREWAWTRK